MAKSKPKKAAAIAANNAAHGAAGPNSILALAAQLNKQFGAGTIMLGDEQVPDVEFVSTGIPILDAKTGGGMPRGRVVEIFGAEGGGKTTTTLHIVAACQQTYFEKTKRYGVAAFIDAEHALDPIWARNIGVDTKKWLYNQPSSGEEAFSIIESCVKSGLVDIIVVDSVAAMIPKDVLDGTVNDNPMAAVARLMSKGLGRLSGLISNSKAVVVFVNQIRHKVGVMFGCLHGDTPVNFVDGRSIPIGRVVAERIAGEVWAYDDVGKKFVPRRITGWHDNGKVSAASQFVTITATGPGNKNGVMSVTVTPSHEVKTDNATNNGWLPASSLVAGSRIMTKYDSIMSGEFGDFLRGVLVGDSHISRQMGHFNSCLKIRDNTDLLYAEWKVSKLAAMGFKRREYAGGIQFESEQFYDLTLCKEAYPNRDPMLLLNNFTWLGMAIWIMDDATYERDRYHLSIKRIRGDFDKIEQVSRAFDKLGLYHYASQGGNITFDRAVSDIIANNIEQFVPPCMSRKLPPPSRRYRDFSLSMEVVQLPAFATVISVKPGSARKMKKPGKFDISIDGHPCYLAGGSTNGLLVHNSPETTPGGLSLKFYSSIRIDLRRGETIKAGSNDDGKAIGVVCKVKTIKNKVAPPYRNCTYNIYFGEAPKGSTETVFGVDKIGSLFDAGIEYGVIDRSGSSYGFKDERLGSGRENSIATIHKSPEFASAIRDAILVAAAPTDGEKADMAAATDDELNEHLGDDENVIDEAAAGVEDEVEDLTTARE